MAARKLQQEVDKTFKKIDEGVAEFENIYEKIEQSNNPAQKEKLEDNLKREIKKLQRLRDQVKTWAANNDIKDKAPLLDKRKLIETQMERFKAVEKAMKTKAYSKEGLSAAAKLDPKEKAKLEMTEFLSSMVDQLEQQIEALETEAESIQVTMKKGKNQASKVERLNTIEGHIEHHKWHQSKIELISRTLENGGIETDQINDIKEQITYYVESGMTEDYVEDDEMYDMLDLQDEDDAFGAPAEDNALSQDAQSAPEEAPEPEPRPSSLPGKARNAVETASATGRKASAQVKSPLPTLATLNPLTSVTNTGASNAPSSMKPAQPPKPPGEGLKYASAAAAAAASDKNNVGIAPLPPPPGSQPVLPAGYSPLAHTISMRGSAANSPSITPARPVSSAGGALAVPDPKPAEAAQAMAPPSKKDKGKMTRAQAAAAESARATQPSALANEARASEEQKEEEPYYHLPAALSDLVDALEATTKRRPHPVNSAAHLRMLNASHGSLNLNALEPCDSEPARLYKPEQRCSTTAGYPQEPLQIFEDPRLYSRIEPDTLFYVFYYKQNTSQQYLAAKALKDQSWRFHKQYQTWFQRHEEPKSITEEFEQGTYRFFDYESTWYVEFFDLRFLRIRKW